MPLTSKFVIASLALSLSLCAAADSADAQSHKRDILEEVIVTAQRREESAQDVAISMTVFNQTQIADANMTNASDIATYTPSLSVDTRFGNEMTSFSIRGFTQALRTTASVGTYFAEVVAPRGQSSQTSGDGAGPGTLFDLQNLQVLKGPQGTLFGRNTTGGSVLITPNKPSDDFDGYIEFSSGDFGMEREQAVVNIPLNDVIKLRLGLDKNQRDGHLNNVTQIGANQLGNTHYLALRASITVDFSEQLENYTIFTYVDSETAGYSNRLFACNPSLDPSSNPFYAITGPGCAAQLSQQEASGKDGFYDLLSTVATPITAMKELRAINTTSWDVSERLSIKNIIAYAHLETNNGSDIFGSQFTETAASLLPAGISLGAIDAKREFVVGISAISPDVPVTSQETWIEEIQLQGSALENALIWQAGAYYESSMPDGFSGNNSAGLISCQLSTIEGDPSQFNCNDPTNGVLGSVLLQQYKTEYFSTAVYAQASYQAFETLTITSGLRYTWDEASGYGIKDRYTFAQSVPLGATTSITRPQVKSEAPTGLLELNYKPVDDIMLYAKYVRGYRQGSVNLAADAGADTHDPETVDTYEIGAKTSFGGPLPGRFNIAIFDNDFTDMQLQTGYVSPSSGATTSIFNAGKAMIRGFEAEALLQLTQNLSANLSFSYLDTELLEQENNQARIEAASGPIAGATYAPIADTGDSLPFASDYAYVLSLNYQLPVSADFGDINLGLTYVYTGEQRAAATSASPFAVLEDYSLINLNLNWKGMFGEPIDLAVFATNVAEEEYLTFIAGSYNTIGFETRQMGLPRMLGARIKYNFGAY